MSQPPKKKPPTIIYETEFHGKKLAVATERYNWIIIRCRNDENPLESDNRWYFSDLAAMLKALHKFFIRERIKRLDFEGMARIVERSYEDVEKMGHRLVIELADKAGYGALPHSSCDRVVETPPTTEMRNDDN